MKKQEAAWAAIALLCICWFKALPAPPMVSHAALRPDPLPAQRARSAGQAFFVDGRNGSDQNPGSEKSPWKTIRHAFSHLKAGATLYLRGGVYFENVYCALAGNKTAPVTVRAFPGEQAVIDGGLREFQEAPGEAWQPYPTGGPEEYRSTRAYPNMRDFVGAFGDSMIGLQTYWHAMDLRGASELSEPGPNGDVKPLYCGPGLWYDRKSGHIHVRLSHTKLQDMDNYRSETDPRKVPLILAPYKSVPLHIDDARHVRFQDLIIRGGGYETVVMTNGFDVEFDNVIIRGGTYCMRTENTVKLKFYRSAMYGNAPPWAFRGDSSLRARPGRKTRDLARLTCHALWVTNTGREYSVHAFPANDDWDISYSEFTDSHDGLYLGGIGLRFHHNLVDNFQDDGIYLSPMYSYGPKAVLHIHQNIFRRALTTLAFGGPEDTQDRVFIYRNYFDMRGKVNYGRPSAQNPKPGLEYSRVIGDHGGPTWSSMLFYHNTFVMVAGTDSSMGVLGHLKKGFPRKVFNNIFVHQLGLPGLHPAVAEMDAQADGNLYWSPKSDANLATKYFSLYRTSAAFANSKKIYAPGFDRHSLVADPQFFSGGDDIRLKNGSPAIDAGVALPADWPDPLRAMDKGRPDIGACPLGSAPMRVGRDAAK
ncbi:MAG: hypothetical protein FJ271_26855 [Planctomycetes bacterium]|nr:hypothetical protein [Planctomycetota bacterium]